MFARIIKGQGAFTKVKQEKGRETLLRVLQGIVGVITSSDRPTSSQF